MSQGAAGTGTCPGARRRGEYGGGRCARASCTTGSDLPVPPCRRGACPSCRSGGRASMLLRPPGAQAESGPREKNAWPPHLRPRHGIDCRARALRALQKLQLRLVGILGIVCSTGPSSAKSLICGIIPAVCTNSCTQEPTLQRRAGTALRSSPAKGPPCHCKAERPEHCRTQQVLPRLQLGLASCCARKDVPHKHAPPQRHTKQQWQSATTGDCCTECPRVALGQPKRRQKNCEKLNGQSIS